MRAPLSRFLVALFGLTREERLAVALILALALLALGALAWHRQRAPLAVVLEPEGAARHCGPACGD